MYARVHGTITWHHKTLAATDAALGVWVRLLGHCAEHLTDGFVPEATARAVSSRSPKAIQTLLQAGFIEQTEGGYQLTNYLEHNASRLQIEDGRTKTRNRVKRSRSASCNAVTTTVTNAVTNAVRTPLVTPVVTGDVTLQEVEVEEDVDVEKEEENTSSEPQLALIEGGAPAPVHPRSRLDVSKVFKHWQATFDHPNAVLDDKRRRKIESAIKSHGLQTVLAAITGCSRTPWNMGENPSGKKYDDLTLILRDASKIEGFASRGEVGAWGSSPQEPAKELERSRDAVPFALPKIKRGGGES